MPARIVGLLAVTVLLAGCGGGRSGAGPDVRVSAAASLKTAFIAYGDTLDNIRARFSFAGSDQLAGQIRSGLVPDVFAAANAELPRALFAEGLVERPVAFARNELVLAVPAGDSVIASIDDLAADGVRVAVGSRDVPVGSYTRTVLGGLGTDRREAILANVRSEEPDVSAVVGKLATGAVDAGFVYRTDVAAAGGRLRAIALPPDLDATVVLEAAVVAKARQRAAARAFVDGLVRGGGSDALRAAGFLPPP